MDDLLGIPTGAHEVAAALCVLLGVLFTAGAVADLRAVFTGKFRRLNDPLLAARLRSRRWTALETAWLLLALATAWLLLSGLVSLLQGAAGLGSRWSAIVMLIAWTVALPAVEIGLIALVLSRKKLSVRDAFGIDRTRLGDDVAHGLLYYAMSLPVVAFYSILYVMALRWMGCPTEAPQEVVRFMLDQAQPLGPQLFVAGVAVVIAPAAEEILFRGILLPLAAKHVRLPLAVCFVSMLFAVLHGHAPSVGPLFVLAVALSLAYLYSGSILVPIAMHAAFNAVSLATMVCIRLAG